MIKIILNNNTVIETDKIGWVVEEARYAIMETNKEDIEYYTKECGLDTNGVIQTIEENVYNEFEDYVVDPYDGLYQERKLTHIIVESGHINGEPIENYCLKIKKDMIKKIDIIGGQNE